MPKNYDGFGLSCDSVAADWITVGADVDKVSIVIDEGTDYTGSVLLTPKHARKLAKALKALAAQVESENANG